MIGLEILKNTPFWAILGQLIRLNIFKTMKSGPGTKNVRLSRLNAQSDSAQN